MFNLKKKILSKISKISIFDLIVFYALYANFSANISETFVGLRKKVIQDHLIYDIIYLIFKLSLLSNG